VLLIIIGLALPRTHHVEVAAEIDAHPATVFALLNDFRRYALWSPLLDTDPNVRLLYSGKQRGVGAAMTWDGTIVGSGTQTIVASTPYNHIGILMNAGEPGEARSRFDIARGAGTTIVTWGFDRDYGLNLVGRYFAPMFGGVVARDFAGGLANLKELAESLPVADFSDIEIEHVVVEASEIAYVSTKALPEPGAISEAMGTAYFRILSFIDAAGLEVAGPPLSILRGYSGAELVFDAAIPVRGVTDSTPRSDATIKLGHTFQGAVIRVKHVGSYRTLAETHRKISAYLAAYGIERDGAAWESYISDPGNVPEKDLLTYVYYPIKPT
jgi:effector-binding domain-containing protein